MTAALYPSSVSIHNNNIGHNHRHQSGSSNMNSSAVDQLDLGALSLNDHYGGTSSSSTLDGIRSSQQPYGSSLSSSSSYLNGNANTRSNGNVDLMQQKQQQHQMNGRHNFNEGSPQNHLSQSNMPSSSSSQHQYSNLPSSSSSSVQHQQLQQQYGNSCSTLDTTPYSYTGPNNTVFGVSGSLSNAPPHHPLHQTTKLDLPRRRGVVKFFNSLKGFGFVVDNDPGALGGQEVFCHFSAISGKGGFRSLAEGEEVEYELVQGPKGFQAANLTGPSGRTVVGDPKARLAKPPTATAFLPFAPHLAAAMGVAGGPQQFLSDPYLHAAAHSGFSGSPYTQHHVVYVPTSVALPSGSGAGYGYGPTSGLGRGGDLPSSLSSGNRSTSGGPSPFGPGYSFTPPGPLNGSGNSTINQSSPSRVGNNYSSSTGSSQFGGSLSDDPRSIGRNPQSQAISNGNLNNLQSSSFGFAPFSPPTSRSQLPTFEDGLTPPSGTPNGLARPGSGHAPSSVNGGGSHHSSSTAGSLNNGLGGSAFDGLRPSSLTGNGSRSVTPNRSASNTSALGNGALGGSEWKSSGAEY